jgi:hypothetical protein
MKGAVMKQITGSLSLVVLSVGVLIWWWASPGTDYCLAKEAS